MDDSKAPDVLIDGHDDDPILPCAPSNYSHSFKYSMSKNVIAFETGYFGLVVNSQDLKSVLFKEFEDPNNSTSSITYLDCLQEHQRVRMEEEGLDAAEFYIALQLDDMVFVATRADESPRLFEAGKICQRYDFQGLHFRGLQKDAVDATLIVLVWPDSITFQLDILKLVARNKNEDDAMESSNTFCDEFKVLLRFRQWSTSQSFVTDTSKTGEIFSTILSCNFTNNLKNALDSVSGVNFEIETKPSQLLTSDFNKSFNCFLISGAEGFKRSFLGGYRDIREYDEFEIKIRNSGMSKHVPVLIFVQPLANPTGVCPIVCDEDGNPTGVPIQLSKNWHIKNDPPYGRFYCYLPAKGKALTTFRVRVVYGFYGKLPSASHANLSVVGYDVHGTRWEQLAIGCWGETYCMDIDMALTKRTITDIRMLMTKGEDNVKWRWTDAGWGGDWATFLVDGVRLLPFQWKCAYVSHGPCLTDVIYTGWYGEDRNVYMSANVNTMRTDDYCRTISRIKYSFRGDVPAGDGASLFKLGSAGYICTPTVAWGNVDGLIEERKLEDISSGVYLSKREMEGEGPWWFGFPRQKQLNDRKWGKGWRALIIRKFEGKFGEEHFGNPSFSLFNNKRGDKQANITFMLQLPESITSFSDEDWVSFEIEIMTFPHNAADYYGPNKAFTGHLKANPNSWSTIYREAIGNNLCVQMHSCGTVVSNYPIVIATVAGFGNVSFSISGGIGAVPIKFTGLCSRNFALYQKIDNAMKSLNQGTGENDFWQTDFVYEHKCAEDLGGAYCLSFNIQLDDHQESEWVLTAVPQS